MMFPVSATRTTLSRHSHRSLSTAAGATATGEHFRPNRFTAVYNRMQTTCPDAISTYAQCVQEANEQGSALQKNACSTEFAAVQSCWAAARNEV